MDVENTPAQDRSQEMPPQVFEIPGPHYHMEQTPAAPQHSTMGHGSVEGSEAEDAGDPAAATEMNVGNTPGQARNQEVLPHVSEIPGRHYHLLEQTQQDAPAEMEVDKAAPASSMLVHMGESGDQDVAGRPTEDATAAGAASHALSAAEHPIQAADCPIQAPSPEPNEAPAADRPVQAPSSEPIMAMAEHPVQAPSSEPHEAPAANLPVQAPSYEPIEALHMAAESHRPGNGGIAERQKNNPEVAQEAVRTPLVHVRTETTGLGPPRGEGSCQEAAPGGKESLELPGRAPAADTPGALGPSAPGTPRVWSLSPVHYTLGCRLGQRPHGWLQTRCLCLWPFGFWFADL